MDQDIAMTPPLHILVVPADLHLDVAPLLPALKSHFALVCPVNADVAGIARRFEPQVVLVDERVPNLAMLRRQLAGTAAGRNPVLVALTPAAGPAPAAPPGYAHCLPMPATAAELEHLLWDVRRSLVGCSPSWGSYTDSGAMG